MKKLQNFSKDMRDYKNRLISQYREYFFNQWANKVKLEGDGINTQSELFIKK